MGSLAFGQTARRLSKMTGFGRPLVDKLVLHYLPDKVQATTLHTGGTC